MFTNYAENDGFRKFWKFTGHLRMLTIHWFWAPSYLNMPTFYCFGQAHAWKCRQFIDLGILLLENADKSLVWPPSYLKQPTVDRLGHAHMDCAWKCRSCIVLGTLLLENADWSLVRAPSWLKMPTFHWFGHHRAWRCRQFIVLGTLLLETNYSLLFWHLKSSQVVPSQPQVKSRMQFLGADLGLTWDDFSLTCG